MTVELTPSSRKDMIDTILVVGNLVGAATVDAVPRGQGRLEAVYVKLGDPVRRGQAIAKIEDREIVEQIKQAGSDAGRIAGDHPSAPGRPEARTEQHGALEEPVRARSAPPADL
jgi:multidrug efflux pump subunit AcrA (membrane-fusion protein)